MACHHCWQNRKPKTGLEKIGKLRKAWKLKNHTLWVQKLKNCDQNQKLAKSFKPKKSQHPLCRCCYWMQKQSCCRFTARNYVLIIAIASKTSIFRAYLLIFVAYCVLFCIVYDLRDTGEYKWTIPQYHKGHSFTEYCEQKGWKTTYLHTRWYRALHVKI